MLSITELLLIEKLDSTHAPGHEQASGLQELPEWETPPAVTNAADSPQGRRATPARQKAQAV